MLERRPGLRRDFSVNPELLWCDPGGARSGSAFASPHATKRRGEGVHKLSVCNRAILSYDSDPRSELEKFPGPEKPSCRNGWTSNRTGWTMGRPGLSRMGGALFPASLLAAF